MIQLHTTLTEEEYEVARAEARKLGISVAELLRRALLSALPDHADRPWMRYAGMVDSGDRQSSVRVDDVVYGRRD